MRSIFKIPLFTSFQVFLLLFFLGLLVYANAIFHPFVHDDITFIQKNPFIANIELPAIFSSTVRFNENSNLINDYYRPLLEIAYSLQYKAFRFNPHAYHFFNILLHIANSFMVYCLIHLIPPFRKMSWGVAIFFLIHPIQTEAVACISGISNLLFTFLCLSSFYIFLKMKENGRSTFYSSVLFLLALFTKEQAVVLPFLILWYALCLGSRRGIELLKQQTPFFMILLLYFMLRYLWIGSAIGTSFGSSHELGLRLLSIPRTLLMYGQCILFPYDLHYYRSIHILQLFLWPTIMLGVAMIAIGVIIACRPASERRMLIFALGWFFITLGPLLNILPLVNEYSLILTSEHFLYLPLVGPILFISVLIKDCVRPYSLALVGLIFMLITIKQNTYWKGEIPLFQRVVRFEKNFGRGHMLLAKAYLNHDRFNEAIVVYQKALGIMQSYVDKVPEGNIQDFYLGFIKNIHLDLGVAHNNLGVQQALQNNRLLAIHHFQKSLQFNSNNQNAQKNLRAAYLQEKVLTK